MKRFCWSSGLVSLLLVWAGLFQLTASEALGQDTLSIWILSVNPLTGEVLINGVEMGDAVGAFTWEWGDGTANLGFFCQTHTYANTSMNYVLRVTTQYTNGTTDYEEILIKFGEYSTVGMPDPYLEVDISDADLKEAILVALSHAGAQLVTRGDVLTLTTFYTPNRGIASLVGLEHATNLIELTVASNEISDLSPLTGLINLEELSLHDNQISDISALAGLTNLSTLWLTGNPLNSEAYSTYIPQIQSYGTTVYFDPPVQRTLNVTSSAGGSVTAPGEGEFSYDHGMDVQLQAEAEPGYRFTNWSGSLWSAENPTWIKVDQDCEITANFEPVIPLTAHDPCPADGAEDVVSPVLRWQGGQTAAYHDIYFGRTPSLTASEYRGYQAEAQYTIPFLDLQPGVKYYWRVDAVEGDGVTRHVGTVWSFTVAEPSILSISATPNGAVLTPGEGQFQVPKGTVLGIEAAPSEAAYGFLAWTGTAVDSGKVEDPNASATTVLVDADYTLEAVFVERPDGPVLGFSVGQIESDDPNEFYYRVSTNNTAEVTFVQLVAGVEPDPNGMVRMQVIEGEPARAKGRFGRCSAERVLVQFQYLFETPDATEIVVYLSDVPQLLDHSDPSWSEHYLEIGRVPAPPGDCPGAFGSGRFATFEQWVWVEGLDVSDGTWVELELIDAARAVLAKGGVRLASGGSGGSAVFDALSVQVHCSGYCLDLNFTKTVDSEDLLLVMAGCGSTAELDSDSEGSRYCLDGAFSSDGYVDAYDIHSLIWALNDLSRVDCGSLCRVPLPLTDTAVGIAASGYSAASVRSAMGAAGLGPWLAGMMVLYKNRTDDLFCLFDATGTYVTEFTTQGLPVQGAARIVRGAGDSLYIVSTEEGVLRINDPVERIIPPGEVSFNSATVYIGIQGSGSGCFGRPILDAAFDAQGYAYVVPVVVKVGQDAYVSAARLELLDGQSPPYRVVNLYDDPAPANDNRRLNHLREIEIDGTGNVYIANVHRLNESCILWKYAPDGTLLKRLSLLAPNSSAKIEDPVGLHISDDGKMLYLACGQQDLQHPGRSTLYGLSTQDLSLERTITIEGMPVVTSITQDPTTDALWATGYSTAKEPSPFPWLPPRFTYTPKLAKIPADVDTATVKDIADPGGAGLAVPTSILWTGTVE